MSVDKKRREVSLLEFFVTGPVSYLFIRMPGSLATVSVWMLLIQSCIRRLVRRSIGCPGGQNRAIGQLVRSSRVYTGFLLH